MSSVKLGFEELRHAARRTIEAAGFQYVGMEEFGSQPNEANLTCWLNLASCDLFIGMLGERYGSLPPSSDQSFTEREYHYARLLDLPCYMLLESKEARDERQRRFLDRVREDVTTADFAGVEDVERHVERALQDWRSTPHPKPGTLFGRRHLLLGIHRALAAPGGGAALVGLPGMGKSALLDTVVSWFRGRPTWDVREVRIPEGGAPLPIEPGEAAGRPRLIAIDDVSASHAGELADAIAGLPDRRHCSILITTRSADVVERFHRLRLETFTVGPLEDDHAMQLLTWEVVRAAGDGAADYDDLTRLQRVLGGVARAADGHPEALVLVGARIGTTGSSIAGIANQARALERTLTAPSDGTDLLTSLDDRLLASVVGSLPEAALDVLTALSVLLPRPISVSRPDLTALWERAPTRGGRPADPDWLLEQLGHLVRARLLHVDDADRYQMPGIVARHVRQHRLNAGVRRALHAVAADVFQARVQEALDSLTSMFAIETREWQELIACWLYHLAPIDFSRALFWLVSWYLDAFWWWGCYVPFPLCDLLVHAWEHAAVPADSRERHRASVQDLRALHEQYPRAWRLGPARPLLHIVQAARGLAAVADVDVDSPLASFPDEDGSRLHLRGLLHLLMADCLSPTHFEAAIAQYDQALAAFELRRRRFGTEVDAWHESWIAFEQADHCARHGDLVRAAELCGTAEERELQHVARVGGEESPLQELLANVARVRADIAWAAGDVREAGRQHALAIFGAYAFQVLPPQMTSSGDPGSPALAYTGGPDPYTAKFYDEVCGRARRRYDALTESRPAEATVMAAELLAIWGPCRPDAVDLFPAPLDWRHRDDERIRAAWKLVRCVLSRLRRGT